MDKFTAAKLFESLSSGVRLDVYRLLVRHGLDGLVAGAIAEALDIPPTNLSFHLKALTQAGLLTVTQEGRFQRYRANIAADAGADCLPERRMLRRPARAMRQPAPPRPARRRCCPPLAGAHPMF